MIGLKLVDKNKILEHGEQEVVENKERGHLLEGEAALALHFQGLRIYFYHLHALHRISNEVATVANPLDAVILDGQAVEFPDHLLNF